ncbi:3-isopropylmalate dehydrogenase [Chondrinema litorale]|uniref:3-isopropylmalate dehydrogenase n=1 Tax=Chondrinema litorale TaxID=2994555 RepID=UPI0025430184|nr:3-isopropylmalate dehydrogenase [Chondrinema litorale]UZR96065.1 3-isopropylmalate dehydrogenase [Chondrinema litorale]
MKKNIAVLSGDGIGPEVTSQAIKVLNAIADAFNHEFEYEEALVGAIAIDETGDPFPEATYQVCKKSDAVLFGAIGDPKYDNDPTAKVRPEQGLLRMRKMLGLFANIRPVSSYKILEDSSPLKNEIVSGTDFVVFRELTGGLYFGQPRGRSEDGKTAFETSVYTEEEIIRISKLAFETARKRRNKVTLVDKANVLVTSRLWREVVTKYHKENFSDVELEYLFVDNAAMQIILNPRNFDVVLTENLFGDIVTDEASVIAGSLGLLPSASMGSGLGLYEPIHGSYPQATGLDIANPMASILSAAMLLEMSFDMVDEATIIRDAVEEAMNTGFVTKDINAQKFFGTNEVGDKIAALVKEKSAAKA